ncbi:MAG: GNAT family N-acetyltransferase [Planctomycetota bacterium]|nr:GNAT family N-acetyltransferase [Planctomycetota bacterium]
MLHVETRAFEAPDADLYVELARRAFEAVPLSQRQRDTVERVAHLHGSANPAGRAFVAIARVDGRGVGHLSGLPAHHLGRDGIRRIGWQVGCFVVDPAVQRQGVGRGLVEALSRELAARTADFVYTFPNPRSLPVFERHGYQPVGRAATRIALGRRHRAERSGAVLLAGGFEARPIDAAAARTVLAALDAAPTEPGNFVRDPAWFAWRFLEPAVAPAYRFAHLVHPRHGQHVVAIAEHAFRGVRFSVLADACPALSARTLPGAVRCAASLGASRFVYFTTNLPAISTGFTALGSRIPARLDPRPVEFLALPGDSIDVRELGTASILTADWMGF